MKSSKVKIFTGASQFAITLLFAIASFLVPFMGALLFTWRLSGTIKLFSTRFQKLIMAFLLFVVGNAFLYEIFSIFSLRPSIEIIGILYATSSLVFIKIQLETKKIISSADIACLIAALITLGVLFYPIYYNRPKMGAPVAAIHLLSSGEDNASHFALFKYGYIHDEYAYSSGPNNKGLIPSLVNYPQGSEFTAAWLAKSILGDKFQNNNAVLVLAYYGINAFFYALLCLITSLLAVNLYSRKKSRFRFMHGTIVVLASVLLLIIGPLLSLLGRGFQSQIVAYVFLAALMTTLVVDKKGQQHNSFFYGLLMLGGVCVSWWFLAPIALAPLAFYYFINRTFIPARYLGYGFLIALLSAYPITLTSANSGSINAPGGVDKMGLLSFSLFFIGGVLSLLRPLFRATKIIPLTFVAWGGFTALIGVYQLVTIHHLEYYFYKSVYTLVIIGAIGLIYYSLSLLDLLGKRYSRKMLSSLLIIVFVLGLAIFKPIYPRVYIHDWFYNVIPPSDYSLLFQQSKTSKYTDFIYLGSCDRGSLYTFNRWSGAFYLSEGPSRHSLDLNVLNGNTNGLLKTLEALNKQEKTFIYSNNACLSPEIRNYLGN